MKPKYLSYEIINELKKGSAHLTELRRALGCSTECLRRHLDRLVKRGIICRWDECYFLRKKIKAKCQAKLKESRPYWADQALLRFSRKYLSNERQILTWKCLLEKGCIISDELNQIWGDPPEIAENYMGILESYGLIEQKYGFRKYRER